MSSRYPRRRCVGSNDSGETVGQAYHGEGDSDSLYYGGRHKKTHYSYPKVVRNVFADINRSGLICGYGYNPHAEPTEKPRLTSKGLLLGFQASAVSIVSSDPDSPPVIEGLNQVLVFEPMLDLARNGRARILRIEWFVELAYKVSV